MRLIQAKEICPNADMMWLVALVEQMPIYGIDTPNEEASFVATLAHESSCFMRLEENLNYSAERLMAVWPSRFATSEAAIAYARNPEKLANYVYAGRMENGPPESGDGWRYRGRGPIQLTGKRNYRRCGLWMGVDLLRAPEMVLQPSIGIRSACWYWKVNNLDEHDDDEDVRIETRIVNGGVHGLRQRQELMDRILELLQPEGDGNGTEQSGT